MSKSLIEQLKGVIDEQTTRVGGVGNLHGVVDTSTLLVSEPKPQGWFVMQVEVDHTPSLSEALERYTYERPGVEHLDSDAGGRVYYPQGGALLPENHAALLLTLVRLPTARGVPFRVEAPGYQIFVYQGFVLQRSGQDLVQGELLFPGGDTPLIVLLHGGTLPVTVEVAKDVECVRAEPPAPTPSLRQIVCYAVDPARGALVNRLTWSASSQASAWQVYRAATHGLSRIQQTTDHGDGTVSITLLDLHELAPGEELYVETQALGRVLESEMDAESLETTVRLLPDEELTLDPTEWTGLRVLGADPLAPLASVAKAGGEVVRYDDAGIGKDQIYVYRVTAFGMFALTESDFSPSRWVYTNDHRAPKAIDWDPSYPPQITQSGVGVTVRFHCPDDPDYAGVSVLTAEITEPLGDTTVQETELFTDFGNPGERDSFTFLGPEEPVRIYFASFDSLGNRQKVADLFLPEYDPARNPPFVWEYPGRVPESRGDDREAMPRLVDFRETDRGAEKVPFEWARPQNLDPPSPESARVDKVVVFTQTHAVPLPPTTNPWPHMSGGTPVTGEIQVYLSEDRHEVFYPQEGEIRYVQFEPLHQNEDGEWVGGEIRRALVFGLHQEKATGNDPETGIGWYVSARENATGSVGTYLLDLVNPNSVSFTVRFNVRPGGLPAQEGILATDPVAGLVGVESGLHAERPLPLHDKHIGAVEAYLTLDDGRVIQLPSLAFDRDKNADILQILTAYDTDGTEGGRVTVRVYGDSDTAKLWVQEKVAGAWGVPSLAGTSGLSATGEIIGEIEGNSPYSGQFTLTQSLSEKRRFRVQGESFLGVRLTGDEAWDYFEIDQYSQHPLIALDDREDDLVGHQYIYVQERGVRVTQVQSRTQVGRVPDDDWVLPDRYSTHPDPAQRYSLVKDRPLLDGEWETSVDLVADRFSWIEFQLTLETGNTLTVGPFGFDRNKAPNIISIDVDGTKIACWGDSEVKSWKAERVYVPSGGTTWSDSLDGTRVSFIGVPVPDGETWTVGLTAYNASITRRLDPGTLSVSENRNVYRGGGGSLPTSWSMVKLLSPLENERHLRLDLVATEPGTGDPPLSTYTVKLWTRNRVAGGVWSGWVENTSSWNPKPTSPSSALPPERHELLVSNAYIHDPMGSRTVEFEVRAELLLGTGVIDARASLAYWNYTGPPKDGAEPPPG